MPCVCVCVYLILASWQSVYEWRSLTARCIWGHLSEEPWCHRCKPSAELMGSTASPKETQTDNQLTSSRFHYGAQQKLIINCPLWLLNHLFKAFCTFISAAASVLDRCQLRYFHERAWKPITDAVLFKHWLETKMWAMGIIKGF